ncbi:hypothetical protein BJV78DRAFT_1188181 [Lactifluus subvellereus]|nr:hypothetical protein BJV78DRAFT_1188181 [Lactifluus subvellereus]
MKGKAASTVGEADAPDTGSPLPSLPDIESTSPVVPLPPPPAQSPLTSMPASQAKDKKTEERPPIRHFPSLASTFSYSWTSPSTISLAESYAESSRSYLSKNVTEKKPKVKTRPEQQSQPQVEEQRPNQGFISSLFKSKKDVVLLTSEEKKAWLSKVSPRNARFLAQILGADKSAKKGGPPMKWDDFVNAMTDLNFEMKAKKGSEVRFKPPYQGLPKSTFHKPHPENTIDPITLQKWGKKLKDRYGWSEEMLPEHADLQSSARPSMDLPRRSFERREETPQ